MGEKDTEWGIILVIIASVFLLSGLEMIKWGIVEPKLSVIASFVLVAWGVYLIARGK